MRNFAQKPQTNEQMKSDSSKKYKQEYLAQNQAARSILELRRTTGNQTMQLLLNGGAKDLEGKFGPDKNERSAGEFGPISARAEASETPETKAVVNDSGDAHQQEAAGAAIQLRGTRGLGLRCACNYSGEYPKSEGKQQGREHRFVQLEHLATTDAGETKAPPVVDDVLRAPGQLLDSATRAFFEPRFGYDFSAVRVHCGSGAAVAARAVDAQAFTVGNRVVFGDGQFAPQDTAGRRLLAHELTHTVQQGAAGRLQRSPRERRSTPVTHGADGIQRRTFGIAGACWFDNCDSQLDNFFMIPEDGPPGFHPSGSGSFRVDDVDGLWFKYHTPKDEWFKIPDIGTGHVSCTDDEETPNIRSAVIAPFATAGWSDDPIHTPNPY